MYPHIQSCSYTTRRRQECGIFYGNGVPSYVDALKSMSGPVQPAKGGHTRPSVTQLDNMLNTIARSVAQQFTSDARTSKLNRRPGCTLNIQAQAKGVIETNTPSPKPLLENT